VSNANRLTDAERVFQLAEKLMRLLSGSGAGCVVSIMGLPGRDPNRIWLVNGPNTYYVCKGGDRMADAQALIAMQARLYMHRRGAFSRPNARAED